MPACLRPQRKEYRMIRIACILAAASTACATGYHSRGITGGYDEAQLAENVFRVSFEGNGLTSAVKAADYALLRSADVTLERGFTYFTISGNSTAMHTIGSRGSTASLPSTINTIVCYKDRPEGDLLVYDARQVRASLRAKYELDEATSIANAPPPRTKPIDPYATADN
jgi:hypothetical protein